MEECKRNAGSTVVVNDQEASTTEAMASKRRKLVGDDDGGETVIGSLPKNVDELPIGSLGVNSPAKSAAAADGDACSSSFLRSDRCTAAAEEESSCCSSNDSGDVVKDAFRLVDLEAKSNFEFETADSTSMNNHHNNTKKFSSVTTPSSEVCVDSDETESPAAKAPPATETAAKFPPREEIEEFFAMAEKSEQKRFSEKYNYDIAKDLPLEGRYKWVCLKP